MFNRTPQKSPLRWAFLRLLDARRWGSGKPSDICLVSGVSTQCLWNAPTILFCGLTPFPEFLVDSWLCDRTAWREDLDGSDVLNRFHELAIVSDKKRIHLIT